MAQCASAVTVTDSRAETDDCDRYSIEGDCGQRGAWCRVRDAPFAHHCGSVPCHPARPAMVNGLPRRVHWRGERLSESEPLRQPRSLGARSGRAGYFLRARVLFTRPSSGAVELFFSFCFWLGAFTGGRRAPQVRHFRVCRLSAPLMPPSGHLTVCYLPACTLWDL